MDTQDTVSPRVLNQLNDNTSFASTPEQDASIIEAVTKGFHLAPKSKQTLPPKPIVKSKVEFTGEGDSKEDGNYILLQGNPHSTHIKNMLKVKKQPSKNKTSPTTAASTTTISGPTSVCRKASHILNKATNSLLSHSQRTQIQIISNPQPIKFTTGNTRFISTTTSNGTAVSQPPKVSNPVPPPKARTMKKVTKPPQPSPEKKPADKERFYDPIQVKSFMEQQREVRRLKERKEQEERRLEADRKKKQLLELDSKRRDLIARSRHSPKQVESKEEQLLSAATKIYRARKAKSPVAPRIHNAYAPGPAPQRPRETSKTRETKSRVEAHGSRTEGHGSRAEATKPTAHDAADKRVASEAELRTTMLLQEFESVVHRECLKLTSSVSQESNTQRSSIKGPSVTTRQSRADKRFWQPKDSAASSASQMEDIQNQAATIIQATYRGYKIRKIWREVNEQNFQRHPRRISFYRSRSLQPSETVRRRLPLLSPAHSPIRNPSVISLRPSGSRSAQSGRSRTAFGVSLDMAPYIPPPSGSPRPEIHPLAAASRSSLTLGRRSNRFDEPFPKEALKQLALQSPGGHSPAISDHYLRRDLPSPVTQVNMAFIPGISELLNPTIPTFSKVLKEKVRLLQEMQQSARKSVTDDHTPVKRRSRPSRSKQNLLDEKYYDSDSTQHASIILSGANQNSSSADVTITDDYIGPGTEAMQLAYTLRKSPRLSLDLDSEIDGDNNTIPSSFTFDDTTDTDGRNYVSTRRRRPVKGQGQKESLLNFLSAEEERETRKRETAEVDTKKQDDNGRLRAAATVAARENEARLHAASTTAARENEARLHAAATAAARENEARLHAAATAAARENEARLHAASTTAAREDEARLHAASTGAARENEARLHAASTAAVRENEARLRAAATAAAQETEVNLTKKFDDLQSQVKTIDANVRSTLAKLAPNEMEAILQGSNLSKTAPSAEGPAAILHEPRPLEHASYMLEFAKCQTESLKATAEIQQWLAELRRSSTEDIRGSRRQETVNIAAAVYAAVEEAKKLAHAQGPCGQRSTCQVPQQPEFIFKAVQTTDSLLQNGNESSVGYSGDEFLETSRDNSQASDKDVLDSFLAQKEKIKSRNALVEHFLQTLKSENELQRSVSGPDLKSTIDSTSSIQSSASVPGLSSQSLDVSAIHQEKPIITFADILREVNLLSMLRSKPEKKNTLDETIGSEDSEAEESFSESSHAQDVPASPTADVSNANLELETKGYVTGPESPESKIAENEALNESLESVDVAEISDERSFSPPPPLEPTDDMVLDMMEQAQYRNELQRPVSGPDLKSTIDSTSSIQSSASVPGLSSQSLDVSAIHQEKPIITFADILREKNTLDETIGSEDSEAEESFSESSHAQDVPASPTADVSNANLELETKGYVTGPESPESKIAENEALNESLESVDVAEISDERSFSPPPPLEPTDDMVLDMMEQAQYQKETNNLIQESEVDDLSYQSDFVSQENSSSLSQNLPERVLSTDELQSPLDDAGEEEEDQENERNADNENEKSLTFLDNQEPLSLKSLSEGKNTLDETIGSEDSEAEESFSESSHAQDVPASPIADISNANLELETKGYVTGPELPESKIAENEALNESLESVDVAEISDERSFSPPPPLEPTDDMVLDMMELAQYRDEQGFPIRKMYRKWCVRERDIVFHNLLGEMLAENRSWIDFSAEIKEVKENLVQAVSRRAVADTLKAISDVLNS